MAQDPMDWLPTPARTAKRIVPVDLKSEVTLKAEELIETVFKPRHLKPPPADPRYNYLVDIYTVWNRSFLYLCSRYACPDPNAISKHIEHRFARLRYVGSRRFDVAFMRNNEEWCEIYWDLPITEALHTIANDPFFLP